MEEKGRRTLYRALSRLPAYPAPERVWAGIEKALDAERGAGMAPGAPEAHCARVEANREAARRENEAILRRAVQALPRHAPKNDVFDAIFESTAPAARNPARPWYRVAGIAASVALLVTGAWFARVGEESERVQVTYSEETLYPSDQQWQADTLRAAEDVLAFVRVHCTAAVLACQTPEFKGLLGQYQALEAARRELESQLAAHREQPQLVRYLVRVEKEQTEVGKRLIQFIRI
ncbi:MAG: hypothetical protein ICV83_10155 [Cytophagales bacterium]|nr:hypothetical protein [Cytophagales bacterium]